MPAGIPPSLGALDGPAAAALCPPEPAIDRLVRAPSRVALSQLLGLLDRDVDDAVSQVVVLARRLTGSAVSFLGAVGPELDHYKAIDGAPGALSESRTMAGRTFCHYTHALGRTLRIADTRAGAPWRDVPTVQTLGVAAYLGVPVWHQGQVVGSLCVIEARARDWSDRDVDAVETLAQSLSREFDLRAALRRAEREASQQAALVLQHESLVASVLHDLSSPMLSMQLTLALLRQGGDTPAVQRLGQSVDQLRTLIGELNRHPRRRPGGHEADPPAVLALDAVAGDALQMFEPLAGRDGQRLHAALASGARVRLRRSDLLRVLCNLLGNALKFSHPGGTVTLASGPDAEPGWAWMAVRDEGVGMRPEQLARCTERGYSDGQGRGQSTGLGLAIAQEIVQRHGGELRVRSAVGEGTEVRVRWPVAG